MTKRKHSKPRRRQESSSTRKRASGRGEPLFLYGRHPINAALANPARQCHRLIATSDAAAGFMATAAARDVTVERVDRAELESLLPPGAVHQGLVLAAAPLAGANLEELSKPKAGEAPRLLLALDHVTDPQNVGAILRSCAVFDAAGIVVTDKHAPRETGALAKAAAGALEIVPMARVPNLARALRGLQDNGFWCIGLDGAAESNLADAKTGGPCVLVLGAEGAGLRRLTRETCDALAHIPLPGKGRSSTIDSLNVSTAAAVALYELRRTGA